MPGMGEVNHDPGSVAIDGFIDQEGLAGLDDVLKLLNAQTGKSGFIHD